MKIKDFCKEVERIFSMGRFKVSAEIDYHDLAFSVICRIFDESYEDSYTWSNEKMAMAKYKEDLVFMKFYIYPQDNKFFIDVESVFGSPREITMCEYNDNYVEILENYIDSSDTYKKFLELL